MIEKQVRTKRKRIINNKLLKQVGGVCYVKVPKENKTEAKK